MIAHYFKLVWAKRKIFLLVITTLCIAFIMISFFGTMLHREAMPLLYPMGFELENNHLVRLTSYTEEADTQDTAATGNFIHQVQLIQSALEKHPKIKAVSASSSLPMSGGYSQFWAEDTDMYLSHVDVGFFDIFKPQLLEGRWFEEADYTRNFVPLIASERLAKALFPNESAVDKRIPIEVPEGDNYPHYQNKEFVIIGVINNYRIQMAGGGLRNTGLLLEKNPSVSSWDRLYRTRIAIQTGADWDQEELEEIIRSTLSTMGTDDTGQGIKLNSMVDFERIRSQSLRSFGFAISVGVFVAIILLSNVAIGIFGVFWQNVLRRYNELGIRRAMGSTGTKVRNLILGEALALTFLAFIPGVLIYSQFVIFNYAEATWEHAIPAMLFSASFLIFLVLACALYPSWLASTVLPAEALREE